MFPNPIIYLPGNVADDTGAANIQICANVLSDLLNCKVEIQTYGDSKYHYAKRFIGEAE